jgi:hypothetical protein
MHSIDDKENIFPEQSTVRLRATPSVTLLVVRYMQRIYFCTATKTPFGKQTPYFECELLAPTQDANQDGI